MAAVVEVFSLHIISLAIVSELFISDKWGCIVKFNTERTSEIHSWEIYADYFTWNYNSFIFPANFESFTEVNMDTQINTGSQFTNPVTSQNNYEFETTANYGSQSNYGNQFGNQYWELVIELKIVVTVSLSRMADCCSLFIYI